MKSRYEGMIQIGIVGCGTIGSALAKAIVRQFSDKIRLTYLADRHPQQILKLRRKLKLPVNAVSIPELIQNSDFIIEAASVKASEEIVPLALKAGKEILVLSVGGILNIKNLSDLLKRSRGRVYVPSGAIAGLDAVLGARTGNIQSIQITTRKPLKSLKQSPYFLSKKFRSDKIKKPTLIFKGNASQAIQNFPENINVAASLSLAGIGPQKTRVQIFTSPTYHHNMHEIKVRSSYGHILTQVTNVPSRENPKTSAQAIGSAIATLEKIFSPIKIGT